MQLEIKIIIDFGENGPTTNSHPDNTDDLEVIEQNVRDAINREHSNGAFTSGTEAEIESVKINMAWTSSGDDEE